MKSSQAQFKRVADLFLTVALVMVAISIPVISTPGMAQTAPALSKNDVNVLLKSATTASDHRELAAYYREQVDHFIGESQRFAKQADFMDTQSKRGVPCTCSAPYRYLSNEYAKKAAQASESAAQQERLAQQQSIEKVKQN